MESRKLTRSATNRILGGVAGGIAAYTGLDCGLVRLITAAVVIFTGVGLVLYLLAWALLPLEGSTTTGLDTLMSSLKQKGTDPHPGDYR